MTTPKCCPSTSAAPPLVPNPFGQNLYQIVQTPDRVVIDAERVHDARVIRLNGTHLLPSVMQWTGDSIGHGDGSHARRRIRSSTK